MLTLQDCLDMCDLTPEIIDAIAEHERLPCILAAELGDCLCCSVGGRAVIHRFILDCLADATKRGDSARLQRMKTALEDFHRRHPGVAPLSC